MEKQITLLVDEDFKKNIEELLEAELDESQNRDDFFNWVLFRYTFVHRKRKLTPEVVRKLDKMKNFKAETSVMTITFNAKKSLFDNVCAITGTVVENEDDANKAVSCAIREYVTYFRMPKSIKERMKPENDNEFDGNKGLSESDEQVYEQRRKLGLQLLGSMYLRDYMVNEGKDVVEIADKLMDSVYTNTAGMSVMGEVLDSYNRGTILLSESDGCSRGILFTLKDKEIEMMKFAEKQFGISCCHVIKEPFSDTSDRYDFIMCPNTEEELRWSIVTGSVHAITIFSNNKDQGSAWNGTLETVNGGFVIF